MTVTTGDLVARALEGLDTLGARADEIEDEWTWVTELGDAWRDRLEEVRTARQAEPASPEQIAAVERIVAEAGAVTDPHRAIDWLSTFPQVVLVALGERP
jgi:hypothetical protein